MYVCPVKRPADLPSDEVLLTWPSADIQDYAFASWMWGRSCEEQLFLIGLYNKCSILSDKTACATLKTLEETFNGN